MNDDYSDIENELRNLRPKAPSRKLRARMEAELGGPRSTLSRWRRIHWLVIPAGFAALAFALIISVHKAPETVSAPQIPALVAGTPAPVTSFKPVSFEKLILESRTEGKLELPDGTVVRRVRELSEDTYVWRNPKTKARLEWTVPSEEIRIVPVSAF